MIKFFSKKAVKYFLPALFVVVGVFFFSGTASAQEASLYLSPPTGVYEVGEPFTIRLLVDTDGQDINAAEGSMSYNPLDFEILDISDEGSIFSIWPDAPSFSSDGEIRFGGGSSQFFSGDIGRVLSVSLRPLREGIGRITFSSGAVIAADGQGTNIISQMQSGTYTLVPSVEEVSPEPEYNSPANSPAAPSIHSETHPSQEHWYRGNNVSLSWDIPSGTTATRLLLDQRSSAIPNEYYDHPVGEVELEDIKDGVWFFYVQFQNEYGWGDIGRYQINIDSTAPEYFTIEKVKREDLSDPNIEFIFDAFDATSGIDHFEVLLGDREPEIWREEGGRFTLSGARPGAGTLVVRAVDQAGNYAIESVAFNIEALSAPVLTEYPSVLSSGSILAVRGETYPDSTVEVWMRRNGDEAEKFKVKSGSSGSFTFIAPRQPQDGIYNMWVEAVDDRGARSNPSEEITFAVRPPGFISVGSTTLSALSITIPLIATVMLMVMLMIYGKHHVANFRKRLSKEVREAEDITHKAFAYLKKEAVGYVKALEKASKKRKLTSEEEFIMESLKKNISGGIEKSVEKEIEDIEEELKKR